MANKYLLREDAPIDAKTWEILDETMLEAAKTVLSGRRILTVEGPYGLGLKVVPLADPTVESAPVTSAVLPLALIVRDFTMSKRDLAAFEKDGVLLDTKPVATTAIEAARLEEELLYKGTREVAGLLTAKGSNQVTLSAWDEIGTAADDIINAVTELDSAGFHGPYSLALAPARYNMLLRRYPAGDATELEHIKTIVTEGVVKAPVLETGGILLAAGKQYVSIILGQDLAVGFIGPASERLEFSITESIVPYIRQPKALYLLKG